MSKVTLFLAFAEQEIDRPLSRSLRDRAAALSFGEGAFSYADTKAGEKPRFLTPSGAHFNVTHTKNVFLCAVSNAEVGIDAERVREEFDASRLAERVLDETEQAALCALPERERALSFTRAWTRHEAAAKFTGKGIGQVLSGTLPDLVYTDLTELLSSLGAEDVCATLASEDVPELELVLLEDE